MTGLDIKDIFGTGNKSVKLEIKCPDCGDTPSSIHIRPEDGAIIVKCIHEQDDRYDTYESHGEYEHVLRTKKVTDVYSLLEMDINIAID